MFSLLNKFPPRYFYGDLTQERLQERPNNQQSTATKVNNWLNRYPITVTTTFFPLDLEEHHIPPPSSVKLNRPKQATFERSYLQFHEKKMDEKIDFKAEQRGDALKRAVLSNNLHRVQVLSCSVHTEVKYKEAIRVAVMAHNSTILDILLKNRTITDETRGACLLDSLQFEDNSKYIIQTFLNSGDIPEDDLEEAILLAAEKSTYVFYDLLRKKKVHGLSKSLLGKILVVEAKNNPTKIAGILSEGEVSKDDLGKALCEIVDNHPNKYIKQITEILELNPPEEYVGKALCLAAKTKPLNSSKYYLDTLKLLISKTTSMVYIKKAFYNSIYYSNYYLSHKLFTPYLANPELQSDFDEVLVEALCDLAKKGTFINSEENRLTLENRVKISCTAAAHGHVSSFYLDNMPESTYLQVATTALHHGYLPIQILSSYKRLPSQQGKIPPDMGSWQNSLIFENESLSQNAKIAASLLSFVRYTESILKVATLPESYRNKICTLTDLILESQKKYVDFLAKMEMNEIKDVYETLIKKGVIQINQVEKLLFHLAPVNSLNEPALKMVDILLEIDPPTDVELGVLLRIGTAAKNHSFLEKILKYESRILAIDISASFFTALRNTDLGLMRTFYNTGKIPDEDLEEARAIANDYQNATLIAFFKPLRAVKTQRSFCFSIGHLNIRRVHPFSENDSLQTNR